MNELHLFAGAGGGILAGQLLGRRCVCAVEFDPYAQAVLIARQNDGTFPPFPIWDDVRTFDGRPWRGIVGVVAGGFPCQDVSAAGTGDGLDGARSGLWTEMARIIREVRPLRVEVENSPMLTSRGLGRVLGDLAAMGFDAEWGVVSAADTGAPHLRERIWIVANARGGRCDRESGRQMEQPWRTEAECRSEVVADAVRSTGQWHASSIPGTKAGMGGERKCDGDNAQRLAIGGSGERAWHGRPWPIEPDVCRVVDGMAHRAHRIRALGNGQVPRVAATAWRLLSK
ncbi:DNA cytosine methyltransferase [Ralstonia mannitolilytica]|uniref:DNA cytosine methyltransferase n=1 Tax=Ralstonia mannitolilytica TaxID=105219 RepID=UPI001C22DE42|nr:DNA cytosine methyltransferase [Ralstonia mannitolilytica]